MVPPTLLTTTSRRPSSSNARVREPGDGVEVGQVGGHDDGPPAERTRCGRRPPQLGLGARGDEHVGAGLGERERRAGADAAAGAGDDGDLPVEPEAVQNHAGSMLLGWVRVVSGSGWSSTQRVPV